MATDTIKMTVGARYPIFSGAIKKTGGDAFELTNGDLLVTADISEVRLRVRERNGTPGTYVIDEPVTSFEVAADGKSIPWKYEWAAGDTDDAGQYSGQLRVRLSDGRDSYAPTGPDFIPVVIYEAM